MQMLQQFFGEQGARYITWILTVIVLLILVLVVWNLVKRALGDRLNLSDKPDRRGRPPRLGITESFTVDRQGRRLVMVRRDNVEHLVMIGGVNDFVVESGIVRGERPVMPRADSRSQDFDPMQAPAVETMPQQPAPAVPQSSVPTPRASPEAPKPATVVKPEPVYAPVVASVSPLQMERPAPQPVVQPPVAPVAAQKLEEAVKEVAKPAMSLAERFKAALPMVGGSKNDITAKPDGAKSDLAKAEAAIEASASGAKDKILAASDNLKAKMGEVFKPAVEKPAAQAPAVPAAPAATVTLPAPPPPPAAMPLSPVVVPPPPPPVVPAPPVLPTAPPVVSAPPPVVPPPPIVVPPAPPVVAAPAAAVVTPPPAPPAAAQSAAPTPASKPVSKNPFDSLEEEMAKLLGRNPEGKG